MTNRLLDPQLIARLGVPHPAPGDECRFICPFCFKPDTWGHLYFNSKSGLWKCHRCDTSGNRESLYRMLGIPIPSEDTPVPDEWLEAARSLLLSKEPNLREERYEYCDPPQVLAGGPSARARAYLYNRGLDDDDIVYYEIEEGVGCLGERIVFIERESFDPTSPILVWVARAYTPELMRDCKEQPHLVRRYEHPRSVRKSQGVWNLVRVQGESVIITEGCFDAIAAGRNGVATYGKSPSERQRSRLLRAGFTDYYVAYDSDALRNSLELCHWFSSYNRRAHLVVMPLGEDPSSLGRDRFSDCLSAAIPYEPFETMAQLLRRGVIGRDQHAHHRTPETSS